MLLNLVNNAFYALDQRRRQGILDYRPTMSVSTTTRDDTVELRLLDNGSGIPGDIKARVFEPFFITKAAGEGMGLGLSLSYDIVVRGMAVICMSNRSRERILSS